MVIEDKIQKVLGTDTTPPPREIQNIKSRINDSMLRSKNIVERYVKPIGGEKRRTNSMLKASSSGNFKVQKPKKIQNQREKAKPILITLDLNNPPLPQKFVQHGLGAPILEIRPPDPNKAMDRIVNIEDERITSMSPKRGITPLGDDWLFLSYVFRECSLTCSSQFLFVLFSLYIVMLNIISWNCRGARPRYFPRLVHEIKNKYNIHVMVIMEPKVSGQRVDSIISKLGFQNNFRVEAEGFSGGTWVLWEGDIVNDIINTSNQLIHSEVSFKEGRENFLLTCVWQSNSFNKTRTLEPT